MDTVASGAVEAIERNMAGAGAEKAADAIRCAIRAHSGGTLAAGVAALSLRPRDPCAGGDPGRDADATSMIQIPMTLTMTMLQQWQS